MLGTEFFYNGAEKKFTIRTTRYDILRSNLILTARNPWMVGFIAILVIFFDILPMLSKPVSPNSFIYWLSVGLTFLVYFLLLFCLMVIFQWLWTSFITAKGVLGLHTFWIKEDGLLEKTSYNETMYPYSTIRKFILRDSYMLIQFTNWNGFFIPRREFTDKEGWKAVGKQLLDFIKKH